MVSEIKNIISPDIQNFDTYIPDKENEFSILLSVVVGPKGENTEESFDIEVCTPQWLINKYNENDIILGKDKMIVFKYDKERMFARIKKLFEGCTGNTWADIAIKLSRIGQWEFENYQE